MACSLVLKGRGGRVWTHKPPMREDGALLTVDAWDARVALGGSAASGESAFTAVCVSATGDDVALGDARGRLFALRMRHNRWCTAVSRPRGGAATAVCFSTRRGRRTELIAAFADGSMRMVDVSKCGEGVSTLSKVHNAPVTAVHAHPRGGTMLSVSADAIVLWSLHDYSRISALTVGPYAATSAGFSARDDEVLVTFTGHTVPLVWNTATGAVDARVEDNAIIDDDTTLAAAAMSPDGTLLCAVGDTPFVMVWDGPTGAFSHAVQLPEPATGATSLSFVRGCNVISVLCSDATVHYINLATASQVSAIAGTAAAADACGRYTAVLSHGGSRLSLYADAHVARRATAAGAVAAPRPSRARAIAAGGHPLLDDGELDAEVETEIEAEMEAEARRGTHARAHARGRSPGRTAGMTPSTPASASTARPYSIPSRHAHAAASTPPMQYDIPGVDPKVAKACSLRWALTKDAIVGPPHEAHYPFVVGAGARDGIGEMLARDGFESSRTRLRGLLESYGSFPERHRRLVWTHLLRLPMLGEAYAATMRASLARGIVQGFAEVAAIRDGRLAARTERVLGCLAAWCEPLSAAEWLPGFVFPFVALFGIEEHACFEAVASLLMNQYAGLMRGGFPGPPRSPLRAIDDLLAANDTPLWASLSSAAAGPVVYAWPLLRSAFSEVLARDEWLMVQDHVVANDPSFVTFVLLAWLTSAEVRAELLRCNFAEEVAAVVRRSSRVRANDLCRKAYQLRRKAFADVRTEGGPSFAALHVVGVGVNGEMVESPYGRCVYAPLVGVGQG